MSNRPIVVATRNQGKLVELRALLAPLDRPIIDLAVAGITYSAAEEDVENGDTFEENAIRKARYFYARTDGAPVLADDSGLCVDALGGAPGVRSRRYAGASGTETEVADANSRHLLQALGAGENRRAEFMCAIAYVDERGPLVAIGRTGGRILSAPVGTQGFGYDPLFWSDELHASFGEVGNADKARVSHRARAVAALCTMLGARMTG